MSQDIGMVRPFAAELPNECWQSDACADVESAWTVGVGLNLGGSAADSGDEHFYASVEQCRLICRLPNRLASECGQGAVLLRGGRDRLLVISDTPADGDQFFNSAASEVIWEQAGIRTVHLPAAPHALPIREPARLTQVLLEIVH
jgi:hypothetical protein